MTVKREDLLAAAALGVVQYKQVDPILIFLLQRDIRLKREALLMQTGAPRKRALHYLTVLLAIAMAISLIALFSFFFMKPSFDLLDAEKLLWFSGLYVLFTVALIAWFEWRHVSVAVRICATSSIALVPLALYTSHQIHFV